MEVMIVDLDDKGLIFSSPQVIMASGESIYEAG
jgi:hypothetical protein